jgi:ribosome-associated protein
LWFWGHQRPGYNQASSPVPRRYGLEAQELAKSIVEIASDRQASDIIMLDLRAVSLLADYFVICSGTSERQINALQDDIMDVMRNQHHRRPDRREGKAAAGWILLDYGDVVVHIFAPAEREYYRLEELWANAPAVVRVQ